MQRGVVMHTTCPFEPRSRDARAGLTLLEVVFATAVLALILLGVFSSMAHAMRLDAVAQEREAASRQALQMIDDRVMAVSDGSTNGQFDQLITNGPVSFHVSVTREGQAFNLPPAQTSPNPAGQAGLLTCAAEARGTYEGVNHLILATAKVRWRSAAANQDLEIVVTSLKVRP